ncbi:Crp/Fnr family transcriptional regulator [Rhizosphaericola mali]|uniref:Crp/Fnr family transcriptional regulator n=1 Tax=Rhizosphaericola mali TaxID=2545455 RepID=A0A5P2G8M4_9BACT|nr:Crp/Fnr family transcriptional regulator [Rhizosphaericola mali]QES87871.1 Crp/Fnr family transcriptional regulator [Rhizosphaericola mali]
MEKLKSALGFGGILGKEDIEKLLGCFRQTKLKPNEYFHKEGQIAKEIGFVESGILHLFKSDETSQNYVTKYFVKENQFVVDLESYSSCEPGKENIQALVATDIYRIHKQVLERLYNEIPSLYVLIKSISETALLNKLKDNDFLNFGDAKTKYQEFLKRYPSLARQVPQQYLASYLKITPQSLSRIRKELVNNNKYKS